MEGVSCTSPPRASIFPRARGGESRDSAAWIGNLAVRTGIRRNWYNYLSGFRERAADPGLTRRPASALIKVIVHPVRRPGGPHPAASRASRSLADRYRPAVSVAPRTGATPRIAAEFSF